MPPTSNIRKTSLAMGNTADPTQPTNIQRRTTSGRAIRSNTTRPANYYARPFASNLDQDPTATDDTAPQGFFPAIQYFSDAITALPKEVQRQFTLMKEVEAKIHAPHEKLGELVDGLMELPVPCRSGAGVEGQQGLLSLTAHNSANASANASLLNGVAPQLSTQNSVAGSLLEDPTQHDSEEDLAKRKRYHDLRLLTHALLPNLDEKNVVLAEANRVLALQLTRVDSVLPHIDSEISEEARLGSMRHWAYSDNRQRKQLGGTAASRRDMAAANSLAAAASVIHETEIANARREAQREGQREKGLKGRRQAVEVGDSEFEDKPAKKTQGKVAKAKLAQAAGLGISTNGGGEVVKKRKLAVPPAMERSLSTKSKIAKETPRSTPSATADAGGKKAAKARPGPPLGKKRMTAANSSAQNSPALASSPLHSSFNASSMMEPPPPASSAARPQSARLRQNSTTKLRNTNLAADELPPAASKVNGNGNANAEKMANGTGNGNGKRKARDEADERAHATKSTEASDGLKREREREDVEMVEAGSGSNSGKVSALGSKNGTPRTENFPDGVAMSRTRSTRSLRKDGGRDGESSSAEPQVQGVAGGEGRLGHRREKSNSHLVKQLASFNRSPDVDRGRVGEDGEDLEAGERQGRDVVEGEKVGEGEGVEEARPTRSSRPVSRRNTQTLAPLSPAVGSERAEAPREAEQPEEAEREEIEEVEEEVEEEDTTMPDAEINESAELNEALPTTATADYPDEPELVPDEADADEEIDEEEGTSSHDPDDPNEPRYCYCDRGSYGEMVACDNEACPREWFHLGCTGLAEAPGEEEKWYCRDCVPRFIGGGKRRGKGGGRG